MGLLLNQAYWSAQITRLVQTRPLRGSTMTPEQTAAYLGILCQTFSELERDPDLIQDIEAAFAVMGSGNNHPPVESPSFTAFVQAYERAEREWLMQCGIDIDSAADIIEAVRGTYPRAYNFDEGPDRIAGRVATAARVCCHEDTRNADETEKRKRAQEMRGVFSGAVKVAVDVAPSAGAAVAGMPWLATALSPIAGFSVRSGLQAIVDGTKRWF